MIHALINKSKEKLIAMFIGSITNSLANFMGGKLRLLTHFRIMSFFYTPPETESNLFTFGVHSRFIGSTNQSETLKS